VLIIADDAQWLDEASAVNIRPPLDALDLQEDAARALADATAGTDR
jgi:hypothetical protein